MTESTQGLLAEAKKNKFSTIKDSLSEEDVSSVWENVSSFIERQMLQQKGVTIQGLGTYTFTQKKLEIGNNKYILIQRPIFMLSEKFAQTHALSHTKYHVPGQIPIVQLNYAALSFDSPYDRDSVESCVKEILGAVSRSVGARKNVELTFNGIGRLSIRDSKVKMKFYKEFINEMDGTGKLVDTLQNRPGTVDSVISERSLSARPATANTVILPKLSNTQLSTNLEAINEEAVPSPRQEEAALARGDPLVDDPTAPVTDMQPFEDISPLDDPSTQDYMTDHAVKNMLGGGDDYDIAGVEPLRDEKQDKIDLARPDSRLAMPMAKATGVSFTDDLMQPSKLTPIFTPPKSSPTIHFNRLDGPPGTPGTPGRGPAKLEPIQRSHSMDISSPKRPKSPPMSACGHPKAGQELCYLCHQRTRQNLPVSFSADRRKREDEEDGLLQQYRTMKDAEETIKDQENSLSKRYDLQKMAAFNLGVSEGIKSRSKQRDTAFHPSYLFQRRPLTPPKHYKQEEYSEDLGQQVDSKDKLKVKRKADNEFLERLEQVQLAEDLAAQREQYLRDKYEEQDMYKGALDAQIRIRNMFRGPDGLLRTPPLRMGMKDNKEDLIPPSPADSVGYLPMFTALSPKMIRPFGEQKTCSYSCRMNEDLGPLKRVKYKPLPMSGKEPDSEIFGKHDTTNDKLADKRRRAYELFRDQQDLVAQKKREAILQRLAEQKEEEKVLERTKDELMDDRARRFEQRFHERKRVESDWTKAAEIKRSRELEDRIRALSPGVLLHEQCDKYSRCKKCQRKLVNCGESNIWSESRYIPGSRLMV